MAARSTRLGRGRFSNREIPSRIGKSRRLRSEVPAALGTGPGTLLSMRHLLLVLAVATTGAACSLLTETSGYSNGEPEPDAAPSGPDATPSAEASAPAPTDAAVDAGNAADAADAGSPCDAVGLVAYFPMNEGTGNLTRDCRDRFGANFGGAPGELAWTTRPSGGSAVEFKGSAPLAIGTPAELDLTGAITIAGWIRYDTKPSAYTAVFWNFANGTGYELTMDASGSLYFQVEATTGTVMQTFTSFPVGGWRHVAAVLDPGVRIEVYLDGVSAGLRTANVPLSVKPGTGNTKAIGVLGSIGSSWTGAIDDVRIYSRALSSSEIATLAK